MIRFLLVLSCVTVFSISIFGQSLEADLKKSFHKYKVVKINNQDALRKAKVGIPFKIKPDDRDFQFILRLNDIRTADYTAEYTDSNGRHSLPRREVFTYKAKIIGERNSVVALTVDGTTFEGLIAPENDEFFIESAKKYSTRAADDDKVIYRVKDKVRQDDGICGLDEAVARETERIGSDFNPDSTTQSGRRVLEVATEADKEFVLGIGGGNGDPATANVSILSVLNQVDAIYESQLNLSVVVTYQHAWMPGTPDPYANITDPDMRISS